MINYKKYFNKWSIILIVILFLMIFVSFFAMHKYSVSDVTKYYSNSEGVKVRISRHDIKHNNVVYTKQPKNQFDYLEYRIYLTPMAAKRDYNNLKDMGKLYFENEELNFFEAKMPTSEDSYDTIMFLKDNMIIVLDEGYYDASKIEMVDLINETFK